MGDGVGWIRLQCAIIGSVCSVMASCDLHLHSPVYKWNLRKFVERLGWWGGRGGGMEEEGELYVEFRRRQQQLGTIDDYILVCKDFLANWVGISPGFS